MKNIKPKYADFILTYSISSLVYIRAHSEDWNAIARLPHIEASLEHYLKISPNKANLDLLITDPESAQSKLNEMQKKFVDLFCGADDSSQTESARLAGYKYPSLLGHQLMRKPHVVACI